MGTDQIFENLSNKEKELMRVMMKAQSWKRVMIRKQETFSYLKEEEMIPVEWYWQKQ